ncbi:MAG: peptide/nickel transport system permease protein [Pseudonocardiales bacterium]|jgi:peptide/nickel transport system permease protein|nr:peptide/nickel transport system permease protein [Pseudonocardiales bacterium]
MATAIKSSSGSLRTYLLTRLLLVIPMVLVLVTLVFFVMRVIGDPIQSAFGGRLPPDQIAIRRHNAGLDKPLLSQYWHYLLGVAHGDFGKALTDNQRISHQLVVKGAATLELSSWALLIALTLGIPLGRFAARYRDRLPDVGLRLFAVLAYATPVFFLGLLFQLLFAVKLGWFYSSGRASPDIELGITGSNVPHDTHIYILNALLYGDSGDITDVLRHTVLPAMALGLLVGGVFIRLVRVNLLQTMRSDYVEAARARGVPERRVIRKHAFRNALIPVVTVMGLQIAALLGGSVLTEETFEWQGIGYTLVHYLVARDFVAVQGIVTAIAVIVAFVSFLIDVITAVVDPRVRY